MKIDSQDLMKEFYEQNKEKYSHLSFQQVKDCAATPYLYARKEIESGKLPVIRLKYFGTFLVYKKRAEKRLELLKKLFDNLEIDTISYFKQKTMLENFLTNEEQKKIK